MSNVKENSWCFKVGIGCGYDFCEDWWYVEEWIRVENIEEYYWIDSKVVLGFVSNEVSWFYDYVVNRV